MLDPTTAPLGLGGLVLAAERSIALWRGFKHPGVSRRELTEALDNVKGDVRDALATAQLQNGLERRDLEKALLAGQQDMKEGVLDALNDARQEMLGALDRRRR